MGKTEKARGSVRALPAYHCGLLQFNSSRNLGEPKHTSKSFCLQGEEAGVVIPTHLSVICGGLLGEVKRYKFPRTPDLLRTRTEQAL